MRTTARIAVVLVMCGLALTLWTRRTTGRPDDQAGGVVSTSVDVTPQAMLAKAGENWLSYHGDYTGQRFTRLNQITPANVGNLKTQWVFHVRDVSDMEVTPVVSGGVMFVTAANDAYALDARTGRTIWHYSRPITEGLIDDASSHHNRGVGLWHSRRSEERRVGKECRSRWSP